MLEESRMFLIIRIFIVVATLLTILPSFGQEESDLKSEQMLKMKAEQGEAQAQLEYGKFLLDKRYEYSKYSNEERERFGKEAGVWIRKAAVQDLPEAIFYLGYAGLGEGQGGGNYYERAARAGYPKAFKYVLDDSLFRAGSGADITKAKQFADLARKMNAASEIFAIEVVDICYQAGKPDIMYESGKYTGTGHEECEEFKADPEKHKECLFKNSDNIEMGVLYANGTYVKQDFWKAISHICHGSNVPAELAFMVLSLHEAVETGYLKEKFEYCDYATSSNSMAVCYAQQEAKTLEDIRKKLDNISSKFSSDQRVAYKELEKSALEFFYVRATSEQDLSGILRTMFVIEMELEQKKWFLNIMERLESGDLKILKSNFSEIEGKMQVVYKNLLKAKKEDKNNDFSGAITADGIKIAQESFLTFRDAFSRFGVLRYSGTSLDDWKSWITKVRIEQLESL